MEESIFIFPSFTYANKARKLLGRANIQSRPIKLGPRESGGDCAHGLSVLHKNYYAAVKIFLENGIEYSVSKK